MTMRFGKGVALCAAVWLAFAAAAGPAAAATPAWPQGPAGVVADPAVRFGVLPSGLRYAIMHNETPKGQVAMRLQIQAGSMHEGPGQEGLAHFLEHMAFRGSKGVADGEMIPSLERLGLRFGADSNASTNQTTTTYMFDLPRNDDASVERGLFLLREIAGELTLDAAIAKTESGVVLAEGRTRASEERDVALAQIAQVYGKHPFSRDPIGGAEVIAAADVKQMRAFYDAWYRPEKSVLVVVGDIDVDAIEARIKAGFSSWSGKGRGGIEPAPLAPSGRSPQFLAADGKPQVSQISMTWVEPYELPGDSDAQRLDRHLRGVAQEAFRRRMAAVAEAAGLPFGGAAVSESTQPGVSKTVTLAAALVKDWRASLDLLVKSKSQVVAYGFTQGEIDQVLTQTRVNLKGSVDRAATRPTGLLAAALLDTAVGGHVFRTPAETAADFERMAPQITLERVNARAAKLFAGEGPLIMVSTPDAPRNDLGALKAAYDTAAAAPVQQYAQAAARPWIYTDFGAPGTVVEQSEIPDLGIVRVRFANGVRLNFKRNTTARDQVYVQVRFGRGQGDIPAAPVGLSGAVGVLLLTGGVADYSSTEETRALAGKLTSVAFEIEDGRFKATGSTRPADLGTQLERMTARLTRPGWRAAPYGVLVDAVGKSLVAAESNPATLLTIRSDGLLHSGDPRWQTPTLEELAALSADRVSAFIEPIMTTAPLEVLIAGDTTLEAAIAEVARTFGALPARGKDAEPDTRRVTFPAPTPEPVVFKHSGRPDQAIAMIAWPTTGGVKDPKEALNADVLTAVMRSRLTEQFRAHDGKTYSPALTNEMSPTFEGYGRIQALAAVAPADVDAFYAAIDKVAADLAAAPISADELARAVSPMTEAYLRGRQTNQYWINWMGRLDTNPWALEHMRTMPAGLTAITPADVQESARKWLKSSTAWKAKVVPAGAN